MSGNLDQPGDRGLPPRPELGRPLRHQRRDHRLRPRQPRARWPGRRELSAGAATAAGSSSPTTRRWSRRSSSGTCRSPGRWPTRRRPRQPDVGRRADDQAVLPRQRGPLQARHPRRELSFTSSYGDPQPVAVHRQAEPRRRHARSTASTAARCSQAPDRGVGRRRAYGPARRLLPPDPRRGHRHGPRRHREVWFEGGERPRSRLVHLPAGSESGNRVLVVAAEDYTGVSPVYKKKTGPAYLPYYLLIGSLQRDHPDI